MREKIVNDCLHNIMNLNNVHKLKGPENRRLGVRIQAATDLKTSNDSSTAKRSAIGVSVTDSRR